MNLKAGLPLLLAGALFLGACLALGLGGDLRHGALPGALVLYFVAVGAQLGALVWVVGQREEAPSWGLRFVLAVAILSRLALFVAPPSLSDDAWRYRWEGQVQAAGVNPYATAPADPSLKELRDATWLRVNHREVPAIYGPPLQLAFRALAALPGAGLTWFKLAFVLCDLGLLWLLLSELRASGANPLWILLYAWHPLALLETAGQAHLEVVPVALLVAAIVLLRRGRGRLAALALGTALAAKYLPLLVLPAFLAAARTWRERAIRFGCVLLPGLVSGAFYLDAGTRGTTALRSYGASWSFNGAGFEAIHAGCKALGLSQCFARHVVARFAEVPPGFDPAEHTTWLTYAAKLVVALAAGAIALWLAWRVHRAEDEVARDGALRAAALGCALCFLAGSPTVHPWYALWALPWLSWKDAQLRGPTLLFTLLLPLVYEIQLRYTGLAGSWVESPWVRAAVWLPPLAWGLVSAGRAARERFGARAQALGDSGRVHPEPLQP